MAKRVLYSGTVQGVGFRATAAAVARSHAVQGWVKNLSDGRVELHVDGMPDAVSAYLRDLRNRLNGYIDGEDIAEVEADTGLVGFRVRY